MGLLLEAGDYLRKQLSNLPYKAGHICTIKRCLRGAKSLMHHAPEREREEKERWNQFQ